MEKEQASLTPVGQQVLVNGHQMNVYVEGDGPETIVFLSGAGIASQSWILRIYQVPYQKYKVVIVERAGYGYSDDSNQSRDVMEVLAETRQTHCPKANVTGPFIILSHSIASLESLAWQEKYPDEVKALVGLDLALPSSYEDLKDNQALLTLAYWSSKIGLLRYFPESFYKKSNSDRK